MNAICHPDRESLAKGLCSPCYQRSRKSDAAKREASLESVRRWRKENHERQAELSREWRRNNPTGRKRQDLRQKYGITLEQWDQLMEAAGHVCQICGMRPQNYLCVDHDHNTGRVRGVLCSACNAGIGQFRDSPELLLKAMEYLRRV